MVQMNLFQSGKFMLHSGGYSDFKIECDALTEQDWQALALQIARRAEPFGDVLGIPKGGLRLSEWMRPFRKRGGPLLIVDDVSTTGNSMIEYMCHYHTYPTGVIGWVVFARGEMPPGVNALFRMHS